MKKNIIILAFLLTVCSSFLHAQSGNFESATDAVRNMRVGWNLGNSFDGHRIGLSDVTTTELLRGQPLTKVELIEMMKMAGFNAIRVPITWYPHIDAAGNIDAAWLNRIEEVVNYVLDQDMYCIINIHHDTGADGDEHQNKGWLRASMKNYNKNKAIFENMWHQIATRFKNYNQRLVFEGFNEMLDTLSSRRFPSYQGEGYTYNAELAEDAYAAINAYNRSFVQTVRATGGNNAQRNLMIKTYDACDARISAGHNKDPFVKLEKPEDSNHIIIGIHSYINIAAKPSGGKAGALLPVSDYQTKINTIMSNVQTYFVQRYNTPVVISEWGTSNVDVSPNDYVAHRTEMLEFVDYFIKAAKANNVASFFWMGLSEQGFRTAPAFNQTDLASAMLKAYYGDDYRPMLLTYSDYAYGNTIEFTKQWAQINLAVSNSNLKNDYAGVEVVLAEKPNNGGSMILRAYPSKSNDNGYVNLPEITEEACVLDFSTVSLASFQRLSIVWRSAGSTSLKLKYVRLIRKDGTKEYVNLMNLTTHNATVYSNDIIVPTFIKAKVSNIKYSTLWYGYENLIVPPYVTATAYKVENGVLQPVKTYEEGDIIPEKTGVVLNVTEGTIYKFTTTDSRGVEATGSMMRGSDKAEMTIGGDTYYQLSLNGSLDENSVGFYFGKAGGAAFMNGAHRAYLALPAEQAMSASYLFNNTNGISTIDTDRHDPTADSRHPSTIYWYTLDGQRMDKQPTQKGIYIHKGKKVVVK